MEDVTFSPLSGDHPEHMVWYVDRPPTRWERIKFHFLHFGEEELPAQIVAVGTFHERG